MAYKVTFAGKTCTDPTEVFFSMAQFGQAVPESFYRANSYQNPLGGEPGEGYCILSRKDIDALDKNAVHEFIADADLGTASKLECAEVIFIKATRLIPGEPGDPKAPYLVHFADRRWELKNPRFVQACDASYNVPLPGVQGEYDEDSLQWELNGVELLGGVPWEWEEVVRDLWDLVGTLGTYPELPYEPHGIPQNLQYVGVSAYEALNEVLARLSCSLRYDQTNAEFSIVRIGAADFPFARAVKKWSKKRKTEDDEIIEGARGKAPYGVTVFFHVWEPPAALAKSHSIDIVGPFTTEEAVEDIYHPLWDDMLAELDADGEVSNLVELGVRAKERADQYFEQLVAGGTRVHRVYSGIVTDFLPGSVCKGVAWRMQWGPSDDNVMKDDCWSFVTEVMQAPEVRPFSTPDLPPDGRTAWVVLNDPSGSVGCSGSGCCYEDGNIWNYSDATCSWSKGAAIWIEPANDEALEGDRHYLGRLERQVTQDGKSRPLYIVGCCNDEGGSGGSSSGSGRGDCENCVEIKESECVNGNMVNTKSYLRLKNGCLEKSNVPCGISTDTRYSCVDGVTCLPDPAGAFATEAECLAACGAIPGVSYNCVTNSDGSKTCVEVSGTGGQYATLPECEAACANLCDGFCTYTAIGGQWVLTSNTCTVGCVCGPAPMTPPLPMQPPIQVPCVSKADRTRAVKEAERARGAGTGRGGGAPGTGEHGGGGGAGVP